MNTKQREVYEQQLQELKRIDRNYYYIQELKRLVLAATPNLFRNEKDRKYFYQNVQIILKMAEVFQTEGHEAAVKYMESVDDHDMLHFLYVMVMLMPFEHDETIRNIYLSNRFDLPEAYMFFQYYYGMSLTWRNKSIPTILLALKSVMPAEYWDDFSNYLNTYANVDILKWNENINAPIREDDEPAENEIINIPEVKHCENDPASRLEAYVDGKDNLSAKDETVDLMKKFESISDMANNHQNPDDHYIDYLTESWREQDEAFKKIAEEQKDAEQDENKANDIMSQFKAEAEAREAQNEEKIETITPEEAGDILETKDETYPEPAPDAFREYVDVEKQVEDPEPIVSLVEAEKDEAPILEPMPAPVPRPIPVKEETDARPFAEAEAAKNDFLAMLNNMKPA